MICEHGPCVTGVLVARCTKDANSNIHPISISHMLAAESNLSVGAHLDVEKAFLNLEQDGRCVTITDGGTALLSSMQEKMPRAALFRCSRHLKEDLKRTPAGRASLDIYNKLVAIPKNHSSRVRLLQLLVYACHMHCALALPCSMCLLDRTSTVNSEAFCECIPGNV